MECYGGSLPLVVLTVNGGVVGKLDVWLDCIVVVIGELGYGSGDVVTVSCLWGGGWVGLR